MLSFLECPLFSANVSQIDLIYQTVQKASRQVDTLSYSTSESQEKDVSQFLISMNDLMNKYTMYSKSKDGTVASGGLQQLITKKLKKTQNDSSSFSFINSLRVLYGKSKETVTLPFNSGDEGDDDLFKYLPVDIKLYIFSFLDAKTLCHGCCVNQEWSKLTCDNLLWQHRLQCDWITWSTVSHVTNPQMYLDVECDWSTKEIYLRCSPHFQQQLHQGNSTFNQVSSVLKYFIPKKVPKVALFGPGLEQSTSGLVRKMLYEENGRFTRMAMFPGQFDGVGGGMTMKLGSGHSLHLSVLYSASKRERENRAGEDRLQRNKLLQLQQGDDMDTDAEPQYELQSQIQHLCQTLDAFIFAVDASEAPENISSARPELRAMVRERRAGTQIPLLILSCVTEQSKPRLPACEVVSLLQLSSLSQPWMVIDCVTDTLEAVDTGIVWLIEQAQNR